MHVHVKLKQDPTRTASIVRAYEKDIVGRMKRLAKRIREVVVDDDCFGLVNKMTVFEQDRKDPVANVFLGKELVKNERFVFSTTEEKVAAFMDWLSDEVDEGILEVTKRDGRKIVARNAWQDTYVRSTYQKGLDQSNAALLKAGIQTGVTSSTIGHLFYRPFHADRVGVIYTRNFNQLRGITDAMDQGISRVLAEGMSKGLNPAQIAKNITEKVQNIGIIRGRVLARTEVINAHAEATLNLFQEYGLNNVAIKAEWSTAGWGVCPKCIDEEGTVYTVEKARGLIPFHPNCRCCWIPVTVDTKRRK